ncbi:MAG: ribosomal RNA small subunit methyltransferase A [Candidatus Moranbacteria bacterium RBG_13_45_13]|nr:MAG: ribosomal RNA small subunit methyltransferase A [Candidatus Moranbacteria bacterium RBG_13_45_13]
MKTRLGQNFLTDESIAKRIVNSANLSPSNNVLEIGPGKGILTKYLAKKAKKVLAVELDKALASTLWKRCVRGKYIHHDDRSHICYRGKENLLEVIEGDVLKINLPTLLDKKYFQNYKVVANLPYYITSKVIRLLLETKYPPSEMILMVQKEVGERICAPKGQGSLLSISVKFYAKPEILFYVSRENFEPVPEVDSMIIKIKRRKDIPDVDTKKFFSLIRAGFSAKRKMLTNNLSTSFHIPKDELSETIKKAGLEPTQRAQELSLEDWLSLYHIWLNLKAGQKTKKAIRKT